MSKRSGTTATNGDTYAEVAAAPPKTNSEERMFQLPAAKRRRIREKRIPRGNRKHYANYVPIHTAYDKQKDLLSKETGHFSLVRAMHLADLITELNGKNLPPLPPSP